MGAYMPSVLFVCTANICRSPMAMAIFRSKIGQGIDSWRIESAGTWAIDGEPVNQKVLQVVSERGMDLSEHRSRSTTSELLRSFNVILTMEQGQKEALQVEFPEVAKRVYLITEMVGSMYNVHDPVGGPIDGFRITADEIDNILTSGFDRIIQLAS
jgi:protein arginine phosphatase